MKKATKRAVKQKSVTPRLPKKDSKKEEEKIYHASIKIFGKLYESSGSTVFEAIQNLKPEGLARGVTVLVLRKGAVTQEKILPRLATTRLFAPSALMREIALKNTTERFSL